MDKGICLLSNIPVRSLPDDKSEVVSQLIWCDLFNILERKNNWIYMQTIFDQYEGWISENQVTEINNEEYEQLTRTRPFRAGSIIGFAKDNKTGEKYLVPAGSDLYNYNNGKFSVLNKSFTYDGIGISKGIVKRPIDYALQFLNTPYMWGGRTAFGIDCSGLMQIAFKMAGINIKRDVKDQLKQGEQINFFSEAKPGDLLFFGDSRRAITHIGLLIEPEIIIHAHGKVMLDSMDQQGIYNVEKKKYTHHLRLIKRV